MSPILIIKGKGNEAMNEDERVPISMGGASIIIIFTALLMSVIIVFMISVAYQTYKVNQEYIAHTQAYYVADGEATIKRALIEEQLYKLYFSKAHVKYDKPHIIKMIRDIKGIKIIDQDEQGLLIYYETPINKEESLVVELGIQPMQKGLEISRFTEVNKWQVKSS